MKLKRSPTQYPANAQVVLLAIASGPLGRSIYMLRIDPLGTNPSSRVGIFGFSFITLSTECTPSPPLHTTPTNASYTPTGRYQAPELAAASPASASLAGWNKKHYRNEMLTLTVQEIQLVCTVAVEMHTQSNPWQLCSPKVVSLQEMLSRSVGS